MFKICILSKNVKYQVLIFDNGSTDNTLEVVGRFRKQVGNIIIYHRNPQNLGFARNFKNALRYAKEVVRSKYIFTLGDDDELAYKEVLSDLVEALGRFPECHIARGGFVVWYKKRNFFEKMFLHKNFGIWNAGEEAILNALSHNITFYSGILVNQEYLDYNKCGNGWVDAFVYPFLYVLKKKGFLYLPKITIISKTGEENLAFDIYNSNTDNTLEINMVLKQLLQERREGGNLSRYDIYELINYKIYCKKSFKIHLYYKRLMKMGSIWIKFISTLVVLTPWVILKFFKKLILNLNGKIVMRRLKRFHSYIFD